MPFTHELSLQNIKFHVRNQTCSMTMPGSLGHEEQDAKIFASWVQFLFFSLKLMTCCDLQYCLFFDLSKEQCFKRQEAPLVVLLK